MARCLINIALGSAIMSKSATARSGNMKFGLLLAMLIASASNAFAQRDVTSGIYWGRLCSEPPGTIAESTCIGYLIDIIRTHNTVFHDVRMKPFYCVPPRLPGTQIKAVIVKYLSDNPQLRREDFAEIVTVALARSFPCAH
jgi:hypothetical protein